MTGGAGASARAWVALAGEGRRAHPVRAAALGAGYAGRSRPSTRSASARSTATSPASALRRGGLAACARCCGASASRAPWVLCGHTHRSGPWPRDDLVRVDDAGGTRLINTGSWCYQPHFLTAEPTARPTGRARRSGSGTSGPPELIRLLGDRGHDELRPPLRQRRREAGGVAGHAGADLERQLAARVALVLDERVAPGPSTAIARPLARTVAGALEHRPHPPAS